MTGSQKKTLLRILLSLILFFGALAVNAIWNPPFWAGVLTMTIPYLFIGYDVLWSAVSRLFSGQIFDETFLMSVASLGALLLCVVEKDAGEAHEAAAIMIFYKVGELFQSIAVGKSRRSVSSLLNMMPELANLEKNGTTESVSPEEVQVGQTVLVRPGERVPLDGVVIEGTSELNTAALTGESLPREVTEGDEVVSGCVNLSGALRIKVVKPFSQSTVRRIMELVESAGLNKSKSENFITAFSRVYTPLVTGVALLMALIPPLAMGLSGGNWGFAHTWRPFIHAALMFLIVSCPCALVISVPMSFFGCIGGACSKGILMKGSVYVERLSKCKTVFFDKTGTLTKGSFSVKELLPEHCSKEELLCLAAAVEKYSTHPLAKAIREEYGDGPLPEVSEYKELAGRGVAATVQGRKICAGNLRMMKELGIEQSIPESSKGSAVYLARDGEYIGCILASDTLKEDSVQALKELKDLGIRRVMLTGDRAENARETVRFLDLDAYHAQLLPEDKVRLVREPAAQDGQSSGNFTVAFVGDGINDAPVLAGADVGIAMGAFGSDAAVEAADVVLMNDRPSDVPKAIRLCRKTMRLVKENIILALVVKFGVLILLGLAAVLPALSVLEGYAGEFAVFADVGVSVLAILNAMRAMR